MDEMQWEDVNEGAGPGEGAIQPRTLTFHLCRNSD